MRIRGLSVLLALAGFTAFPALAGDVAAGRTYFRAECALCHSAEPGDNGGAQGPNLQGILGRKAGEGPGSFSYSAALKASGIVWTAETLSGFLANPTQQVPGTAMVIAVDDASDRDNLAAYFAAVRDHQLPAEQETGWTPPPPTPVADDHGTAEWRKDAPGRVHRVDLARLPPPYHTSSAVNLPWVVSKPKGAKLSVPNGFKVEVFLGGLSGPRSMLVAPNGDVVLAETKAGRLKILRPTADGQSATVTVFAKGLRQPYGLAFYPAGAAPQWLYVAEVNRVVRYAYRDGITEALGVPEVVIPRLAPTTGGHYTRDLVFSADGKRLYVAVGSLSNVAEKMKGKSPAEALAWDAAKGFGAAWDNEENRAMVRVFDLEAGLPRNAEGRPYATGLRNCVGLTRRPGTEDLWCSVNERDALGDDLVPDYATRVHEGAWYGWPWYYMGNHEDPRRAGERPDLAGKVTNPDVPFTAHSAATNIKFYDAVAGSSLFPAAYRGVPFVVLHGSWNRGQRTGHKVVTLPMRDGKATGEYIDFLTGFVTEGGKAWGRPVAIAVAKDGSLLLADDGADVIYRISYRK